jgi:hypothetical protein
VAAVVDVVSAILPDFSGGWPNPTMAMVMGHGAAMRHSARRIWMIFEVAEYAS